ncbi:MAG: hypothetical protein IH991_03035 [Planctomycetes bacterium]|nr:hypothetical protein [Planctomycetota bacterium]
MTTPDQKIVGENERSIPVRCLIRRIQTCGEFGIAACCGLLFVVGSSAGCGALVHPVCHCCNNPCDDGLFCNGPEICSIEGALDVCKPGTPVECDEGMVCDEEMDACVPVMNAETSPASNRDG